MDEHTPEPWTPVLMRVLRGDGSYRHDRWIVAKNSVGEMRALCSEIGGETADQGDANLYMLAAAPETSRQRDMLLKAARMAADVLARDGKTLYMACEVRAIIDECEAADRRERSDAWEAA